MASLRSCAIGHHLELRERSDGKAIAKLKEELMKLREAYSGHICSLEDKVKRAEDKVLGQGEIMVSLGEIPPRQGHPFGGKGARIRGVSRC